MHCAVLFTGGLDSRLAVTLLQAQQIEVTAVYFRSAWDAAREWIARILDSSLLCRNPRAS